MNKKKITIVASALFLSPLGAMENATNGTAVVSGISGNGLQSTHHNSGQPSLHPSQMSTVNEKVPAEYNKSLTQILENEAHTEVCKTKLLVEILRDRIDEDLGVKNSWFRPLVGSYASWSKASTLDTQGAIQELKNIESYVQGECFSQQIYHGLAERHGYVGALVNKLVQHEIEQFKNVKGSTIDTVFDSQRRIGDLSPALIAAIRQKVKPEIFNHLDHRLADNEIFFSGPDIQLTPLWAKKRVNVDGGMLVTSIDSKYAKSTDLDGNTVIWDLQNGCNINIDDRDIKWERKRSREEYDPHAVIDAADEHAIFTDVRFHSLLASYPRHIDFVKKEGADGYLMVLFKRPTKESRLCRQAFLNSCGNKEELHQLLNSKTFKKIEGFPATNLKLLIDKELQNIQSKL